MDTLHGARDRRPAERIARIVESVASRRLAGEELPDAAVLAEHSDLLPYLAAELRELAWIEQARREAAGVAPADASPAAWAGSPTRQPFAIPGYRIDQEVHRGGQGVVFRAFQESTGRDVAIKVLRGGPFAGAHDLARFEREVHVLGRLKHAHIVSVHDSGRVGDMHYFVMDFIRGEPLDRHVERVRREAAGRAGRASREHVRYVFDLFARIAEAVEAAHVRGVIHRDLKPSNVCVDAAGEPHVLDFGLAKLTPTLTDGDASSARAGFAGEMTVTGQFVGSLPWSSPEQAEGREIDVRSDVYSLGVMLYHALAGEFPYRVDGPIREVLTRIAAAEPARLARDGASFDREVSAIVARCLRKRPEERYQSAGALARDLRAYLAGDPILARGDSAAYLLSKLLRRHRAAFALGAAALVALASFGATTAILYIRSERHAAQAERQAYRAERVQAILRDMLTSADPHVARGRDVTVRDVLDRAVEALTSNEAGDPDVEADVRRTLGEVYHNLSQDDAARAQLEAALRIYLEQRGPNDVQTLRTLVLLADVARTQGRYADAQTLSEQAVAGLSAALGPEDAETLLAQNNAVVLLISQGRLDEAERLAEHVLEGRRRALGPEHADTLASLNTLATVLHARDRKAEAVAILETLAEARARVLGEDHPAALTTLNNLATVLNETGRTQEALPMLLRVIDLQRRVLGEAHTDTLRTMNNAAYALEIAGRDEEAEALFRQTLVLRRRELGEAHPQTLNTAESLAGLLYRQRRFDEAAELCEQSARGRLAALGEQHPLTQDSLHNLGAVLLSSGRPAEAEPWFRQALDAALRFRADDRAAVGGYASALRRSLEAQGRQEEAEALAAEMAARLNPVESESGDTPARAP